MRRRSSRREKLRRRRKQKKKRKGRRRKRKLSNSPIWLRRRMNHRYGIHFLFDHHPLTPSRCQILPDSPCRLSLSLNPTSPPTGRGVSPPKVAPTTSITPLAPPPGSTLAVKTPFPPVLNPLPSLHPPPPPLPPPLFLPPFPPLRPPPVQTPSPFPKAGRNVKPQMAAHTLLITIAERPHGSTPVSPTLPQPLFLPPQLRPPSISVLFLQDGRCA